MKKMQIIVACFVTISFFISLFDKNWIAALWAFNNALFWWALVFGYLKWLHEVRGSESYLPKY